MITLPPPYHLIQTTLDMDMNARQRRAARRRAEREAYEQAMQAERIEADPTLKQKVVRSIAIGGITALAGLVIAYIAIR